MKIFFLAKIILGKFFLDEANYFDVAIVIFFLKLPHDYEIHVIRHI